MAASPDSTEKLASPWIAVLLYGSCIPMVLSAVSGARAETLAHAKFSRGLASTLGLAGSVAATVSWMFLATWVLTPPTTHAI